MGVYHGFKKNETATMFFLKKLSSYDLCPVMTSSAFNDPKMLMREK